MTEQCSSCRFWQADPQHADDVPSYGRCRLSPPVLIQPLIPVLMPKPAYGRQVESDIGVLDLYDATQHPVTEGDDWCGSFRPLVQPTSVIQQELARWYDAHREMDALEPGASDEAQAPLWAIVDDAAERIMATPSGSLGDVAAKLRVNLIHTISGVRDHAIVAGRISDDKLSETADLGERGIFDAIVELERGLGGADV